MIDGIRILPYVQLHRRKSRVEGRLAQTAYLDCEQCKATLSADERRGWNCGWISRSPDAVGSYPLPVAAPKPEDDTCPGYLISLPMVVEAQEAHLWWEKGQLRDLVNGRSRISWLALAIDLVAGAYADVDLSERAEAHNRR